jgi:MFS family permease
MAHPSVQTVASGGARLRPGEVAARLDRLPLSGWHWRLALITQATYGFIISLDASAGRLYPFVWEPAGAITPLEYTVLYMTQVGIGLLLGEWLFGFLSDRIGRRRTLMLAIIVSGVFFAGVAFSGNFIYQMFFSGISAMGVGGMLSINVVYMQEIAPPRIRARVSQGSQALGLLISGLGAGLLASFLFPEHYREWIFVLAGLALLVNLPLVGFGLPESPRWLEVKGLDAQAIASLERIERRVSKNGRIALPDPNLGDHLVTESEKVPLRELFSREFMGRNLLLASCWTLIYAGSVYGFYQYIGVYLVEKGLSTSAIFLVTAIGSSIGGVAALLVLAALGERVERKTSVFAGSLLFACGLLIMSLTHVAVVASAGAVLAFLSMSVMFTNLYLYTANAYPTRLRSLGTGWTDGFGHNGAIWGPFVATALFSLSAGGWGWIAWCALPGALVPGILMMVFGKKQRGVSLEALSD